MLQTDPKSQARGCLASEFSPRWRHFSETAYRQGKFALEKLQLRQSKAIAKGDEKSARFFAHLIETSRSIRRYLAIDECRKHNRKGRSRSASEAVAPPFVPKFCNQLQQSAIDAFARVSESHHEELKINEIVVLNSIVTVESKPAVKSYVRRRNATHAYRLADMLAPENDPLASAPRQRYSVFAVKKREVFRPMHSFGSFDRLRQRLLDAAYRGLFATSPMSFSGKGRGGHHAALAVIASDIMPDPDIRCVKILDQSNYYPSISREWLEANLPIPSEYITSTVLLEDERERKEYGTRHTPDGFGMTRTRKVLKGIDLSLGGSGYAYAFLLHLTSIAGLPQGAATSTAIANHIIALILNSIELPCGVRVVNVADDFAIFGPSFAAVDEAAKTLRDAFGSNPAGQFVMHAAKTRTLANGFEFLGSKFHRRKEKVECEPDDDCKKRAKARIYKSALAVIDGNAGSIQFDRALVSAVGSLGPWRAKENWVWNIARAIAARSPYFRMMTASVMATRRRAAADEFVRFAMT